MLKGEWCIDVDWSAFYDQFELSDDVSTFFSFRAPNGRVYSMKVLPMGLKQSVGVAQFATLQLLNFELSVYAEAYIDNVRLIHAIREVLIRDAATLLCRCAEANVTVNEVDVSVKGLPGDEQMKLAMTLAAPLCKRVGPWLGEDYDYGAKTVDATEKTREKVSACLDTNRPTYRTFAAMAGILQYASRTLGVPLAPYFAAVLFAKQRWSDTDRRTFDTGSSVRAEPEGIYRACCRFVRHRHHRVVYVATDSSASAGAIMKGHSHRTG